MSEFGDSFKNSISSTSKWVGDVSSHLKNEACTIGDVASKVPGAIWDEIHDDVKSGFKGHLDREIAVGVSAVVGAGALILARRAPGIMSSVAESTFVKGVTSTGGAYEGLSFLSGTASLLSSGWNADSAAKRDEISTTYAKKVGDNLAPIIETAAAGGVGAVAADRALAYSPRLNVATFESLTEKRDYFFRANFRADREKLFSGAGSYNLTTDVALGGTRANMNALTTELENAPVSPLKRLLFRNDSNVEVVREINLAEGKVSVPLRGTPWNSRTSSIPEGLTDHNHHPLAGILISADDAANARGLNIVRSGDYRGFYVGQRDSLDPTEKVLSTLVKNGEGPALNQLVVNDKAQRAFLMQSPQMELDPSTKLWNWHPEPKYVDYKAATSLLDDIDTSSSGAAKAFASLPKIESPLHPEDLRAITPLTASSGYERRLMLAGTRQ